MKSLEGDLNKLSFLESLHTVNRVPVNLSLEIAQALKRPFARNHEPSNHFGDRYDQGLIISIDIGTP